MQAALLPDTGPTPDELIGRALDAARELCGLEIAWLSEFQDGALTIRRRTSGTTDVGVCVDDRIPLEGTYCQRVVDGRLGSVVPDTAADPTTSPLRVTCDANLGAYVGVPVRLRGGRLYGTLCCASARPEAGLDDGDADMLVMLARLIGDQLDALERVTAGERAQREFLASVSHDLRTPLQAIAFVAEDLVAPTLAIEPAEASSTILRETERLLGMVEDVLLVTQQRAGDLWLHRTRTDLARLIGEVAQTSVRAAGYDRIVVDLPPGELICAVDARRVRQAAQNLVDNALKYSPGGQPVRVSLRRDGTTAVLEVSDQGIGLDAEELEQVGERFFRAGSARASGILGYGLGLATVRSVAEAHDGVLSASSTLGEGSTFRLRLPLRAR